jgi:hypothetical protein
MPIPEETKDKKTETIREMAMKEKTEVVDMKGAAQGTSSRETIVREETAGRQTVTEKAKKIEGTTISMKAEDRQVI